MKEITIKPGTIIIVKHTGWFYKLCRWFKKTDDYDNGYIYNDTFTLVSPTNDFSYPGIEFVILEPKKPYSKAEKDRISNCFMCWEKDNISKIYTFINVVRPYTINEKPFTLKSLLTNKYYKVVYDSSKKN